MVRQTMEKTHKASKESLFVSCVHVSKLLLTSLRIRSADHSFVSLCVCFCLSRGSGFRGGSFTTDTDKSFGAPNLPVSPLSLKRDQDGRICLLRRACVCTRLVIFHVSWIPSHVLSSVPVFSLLHILLSTFVSLHKGKKKLQICTIFGCCSTCRDCVLVCGCVTDDPIKPSWSFPSTCR